MTDNDVDYQEVNDAKASMDHIYDQADPRAYFRELKPLGYCIPGWAKPVFAKLVRHLRRRPDEPIRVLDLGCSYGVNAALLKHDLTMANLYAHWTQDRLAEASPQDVVAYDRRYFESLEADENLEVVGLDRARNAIGYGKSAGLLDEAFAVDLEEGNPTDEMCDALAPVDLQVSTGCVGYVTERTFESLVPVITRGRQPWLANFVLRMFPVDVIAESLASHGYVTEKLANRTFVQRRFGSADEEASVRAQLEAVGIDPSPEIESGCLLAEFYLSRPEAEAARIPVAELLAA